MANPQKKSVPRAVGEPEQPVRSSFEVDEDAEDLQDAIEALREIEKYGTKSLAAVRAELGLEDH